MKNLSLIFILVVSSLRAETASTEKATSQEILYKCFDNLNIVPPRGKIDAFDLVETNNLDLVKCGVEKGMANTDAYRTQHEWSINEVALTTFPVKEIYAADIIMKNRNIEMFEYLLPRTKKLFWRRGKSSVNYFNPFLEAAWRAGNQRLVQFVKDELIKRAKETEANFESLDFFDEKDKETREGECAGSKPVARCIASHDFRIRTRAR